MKNLIITFFTILLLSNPATAARKYQFNFNIGQDNPDEGQTRSSNAFFLNFAVSTAPTLFRLVSSFTLLTGSQQFTQGEFAIGPYIYPLARISKSPAQPFLYARGKVGYGSVADKSRMDTGIGLGVGVDIRLGKKSGLTIGIEKHAAEEDSMRTYLGWYWQ